MKSDYKEVKYSIRGMDCADCALSLERSLAQIKGVDEISVNFTTGLLEATGSFDPQELEKRVEALGIAPPRTNLGSFKHGRVLNAGARGRLPGFIGYLYSSITPD